MHRSLQTKMRGAVGLGLLLWVAALPGNVAAGVNVLFTSLEIYGDWMETWYTNEDEQIHSASNTFQHITTSDPGLSASASSSPFGWGNAAAALGPFSLNLQADSAPASIAYDWGMGCLGPTWINIFATATTRFQAAGSILEIAWSGFADFNYLSTEQEVRLSLRDVTRSASLLDLTASSDWLPWREGGFNGVYQVAMAPGHEYELALSGWITAWDAKYATLNTQTEITVIPEPASVLLLLAAAFCLSVLRHRRLLVPGR